MHWPCAKNINFANPFLDSLLGISYVHTLLHKLVIWDGFLCAFMCLEFCERLMCKSTNLLAQADTHLHTWDAFIFASACMSIFIVAFTFMGWIYFKVALLSMRWTHNCIRMNEMLSYLHSHAFNSFIIACAFMEWTQICSCMHVMLSYSSSLACDVFTFAFACMKYFYSSIRTHEMISNWR